MVEAKTKLRCAVYTRKSTEDGLEQEFNSLDAQYEACSAYIVSQRHEGWTLLPERYDDGGFSGGTIERPGLRQLLADVAAGKIDIILIYKIDRLTRSLSDFARIVDVLDKAGASFVSVTQSFNTTTSMGRLTLNMLLSFAQFEREVTGERIRDKIAASKRKGLWMGGPVPLGYEVRDRKLIANEAEADLVRHIMHRYVALNSVRELIDELTRDGHRTKLQHRVSGPPRGGCAFRRGTLYHLLNNRIYLGDILHKGVAHAGEHAPIVPIELWERVQSKIAARSAGGARRLRAKHPSLLVGLLKDGQGRPMTPTHTNKGERRYRYYVTRPDALEDGPAWRVSAHDLERIICDRVAELLTDRLSLHDLVTDHDAQTAQRVIAAGDHAESTLRDGSARDRAKLLQAIIQRVTLGESQVTIDITTASLLTALGAEAAPPQSDELITLSCDTVRVRRGHELRLIIPPPANAAPPRVRNEKLIALVAEAQAARILVERSPGKSLASIAASAERCRTRLGRLISLSCLAPDIVTAIVEGRQPAQLDRRALLDQRLPLDWREQRAMLGFA